jgi:hypothetical protein
MTLKEENKEIMDEKRKNAKRRSQLLANDSSMTASQVQEKLTEMENRKSREERNRKLYWCDEPEESSEDESQDNNIPEDYKYFQNNNVFWDEEFKNFLPASQYVFHQKLERAGDTLDYWDGQNINMYYVNKNTKRVVHHDEKDKKEHHKKKKAVFNPIVINGHDGVQNEYLKALEREVETFTMSQQMYKDNEKKVFIPPNLNMG